MKNRQNGAVIPHASECPVIPTLPLQKRIGEEQKKMMTEKTASSNPRIAQGLPAPGDHTGGQAKETKTAPPNPTARHKSTDTCPK